MKQLGTYFLFLSIEIMPGSRFKCWVRGYYYWTCTSSSTTSLKISSLPIVKAIFSLTLLVGVFFLRYIYRNWISTPVHIFENIFLSWGYQTAPQRVTKSKNPLCVSKGAWAMMPDCLDNSTPWKINKILNGPWTSLIQGQEELFDEKSGVQKSHETVPLSTAKFLPEVSIEVYTVGSTL